MRISTGGMMPPEADAVVMVEYTDETDAGLVEIHRGVSPWQNVIQIGDDIKKGEAVFPRGRRLRAHDLGALTGVGISSIAVYQKPRVALISTGDEIVDAETEPLPGQVRNINQHSLAGLIEECGGELKDWGVVRDDRGALKRSDRRRARMGRCRAAFRRQLHGREGYCFGNDLIFSGFRIYFSRHFDCAGQADDFRQSVRQADPRFARLSGFGPGDFRFVRRAADSPPRRRKHRTRCNASRAQRAQC